ncbi:MAG: hypothetical protein GOV02_00830 [Candidatus Aenigmarchaeota archaeon]|nr:hypothetical protein [Candidatus Aenigmarchaeota archaeon]
MSIIIKIDKGTAEKLIKEGKVTSEESKDLSGTELILELKDSDVTIQRFTEKDQDLIEIADVNGTFGIWFTPTAEKIGRMKDITK